MTRQQALHKLWQRLFLVLALLLGIAVVILLYVDRGSTGVMVFLIGNIGGYTAVHRGLSELKDPEVIELSESWWAILSPSIVGGVLALVLYILFLSGIISGDLFPKFVPEDNSEKGLTSILTQRGEDMPAYAKLFFWSFIAGFNQKYAVDIIDSVRPKR